MTNGGASAFLKLAALLLLTAFLGSCSWMITWDVCEDVAQRDWAPRLSGTGLYTDLKTGTLAPGVRAYAPQFAFWSDGAEKRRWVYLPAGAQVNSADPDNWRFPTGAKFWKEFTRDGVRVETRLLEKTGPADGDWRAVSYIWNADESDALATPQGAADARGTAHDVPSAQECMACHGGRKSRVLGFSAIQLAFPPATAAVDLTVLQQEGRLSHPLASTPRIPGDAQTQAALGYLHANCSHCHNQQRPVRTGPRCYDPEEDFDLSLSTGQLAAVHDTPVYRTAVGDIVEPGDPEGSALYEKFSTMSDFIFDPRMPILGTEQIDEEAQRLLRAWIESMPAVNGR